MLGKAIMMRINKCYDIYREIEINILELNNWVLRMNITYSNKY